MGRGAIDNRIVYIQLDNGIKVNPKALLKAGTHKIITVGIIAATSDKSSLGFFEMRGSKIECTDLIQRQIISSEKTITAKDIVFSHPDGWPIIYARIESNATKIPVAPVSERNFLPKTVSYDPIGGRVNVSYAGGSIPS